MKNRKFTIDSSQVTAILDGAFKHGAKGYFRVTAEGKCEVYAIRSRLMALGIRPASATHILEQANIPEKEYIYNRVPKSQNGFTTVKADVENYGEAEQRPPSGQSTTVAEAVGIAKHPSDQENDTQYPITGQLPEIQLQPVKKNRPRPLTEEEREAKKAKAEAAQHKKRFQLIETSSGKWGTWDGQNGTVTNIHWTREEALEELARLRSGGCQAVPF
jgi:hypothetical protein